MESSLFPGLSSHLVAVLHQVQPYSFPQVDRSALDWQDSLSSSCFYRLIPQSLTSLSQKLRLGTYPRQTRQFSLDCHSLQARCVSVHLFRSGKHPVEFKPGEMTLEGMLIPFFSLINSYNAFTNEQCHSLVFAYELADADERVKVSWNCVWVPIEVPCCSDYLFFLFLCCRP